MSRWTPCKRREFIRRLWTLGFGGPLPGRRHHLMLYQSRRITLPTNAEYSVGQVRVLLRQVGGILGREFSAEEWDRL